MGQSVAQESSPRERMGSPSPDLTGRDHLFCPGPARRPGTARSLPTLHKVCAGARIWHWPSDQELASPREVTPPEMLPPNNNLLCFTYWGCLPSDREGQVYSATVRVL